MALTLQERVKLTKGMSVAEIYNNTILVTCVEKIDASLKKIAGEIIEGTLATSTLPDYALVLPSPTQAIEWCRRILDNDGMSRRMAPSIISYNQWDTDGTDIADISVRNTCLNVICRYMVTV